MHAKRQSSSETTYVIQATIGHLRYKVSSRFHEGETVSNVRKFPFIEFLSSPQYQLGRAAQSRYCAKDKPQI
jgi:hypothetical protein